MAENYGSALFIQRVVDEERKRLETYKRNWAWYHGNHPATLRIKPGQPDDNVRVNLAQLVVDKGVSFLFGREIEFQLQEGTETATEEYLEQVWGANAKMSLLQDCALNGAVCGHVFVKLVPGALEGGLPRMVNLDPAIVRPYWSPDDITDVTSYKIEYESLDPKRGQVFKKQIIERNEQKTAWTVANYEAIMRDRYQQVGPTELWPFPFAPIVDWKNLRAPNEYFGRSDLENADTNNAINFVASNILRIIRYHAHPKTWGRGFRAKDLEIGPDDLVALPSSDATLGNLEMTSDLASSRQYLADLISLYLRIESVPNLDPAQISLGALSGFALRILYGDLLAKTDVKRLLYGEGIKELNRRVLALKGVTDAPTVTITWPSPLPENKAEAAQQLDVEINKLGTTSKETAAGDLGRDWEVEQERLAAEKQGELNIGSALLTAFERGGQA